MLLVFTKLCLKIKENVFYLSPRPLHTQPTLPLSAHLPAVTHVLTFQNTRKVTSRRRVSGRVDSAKNMNTTVIVSMLFCA